MAGTDQTAAVAGGPGARLTDPPRLLPLAALLRDGPAVFESSIRGSSMAPAIPSRARLRVRVLGRAPCASGDVVFYQVGQDYMVHRVVHVAGGEGPDGVLLTAGDNRLGPDPPVRRDQVLGHVIAVQTAAGWRPPGPLRIRRRTKRLIRALTLRAAVVALWCGEPVAARLAAVLLPVEMASRRAVARFRHYR